MIGLQKFRKTNIFHLLIGIHACAYQGVRTFSFSENFAFPRHISLKWANKQDIGRGLRMLMKLERPDFLATSTSQLFCCQNISSFPCKEINKSSHWLSFDFLH